MDSRSERLISKYIEACLKHVKSELRKLSFDEIKPWGNLKASYYKMQYVATYEASTFNDALLAFDTNAFHSLARDILGDDANYVTENYADALSFCNQNANCKINWKQPEDSQRTR